MKSTFWQKLDLRARQLTPFATTALLVVLGGISLPIPGYVVIAPVLSMIAVYHWAIHRPDLLPAWAVFLAGLLQDAIGGTPFGVYALVFLTVWGIVVSQRPFLAGKPFALVWLGFVLIGPGAGLEAWILVSAYHLTLVDPEAVLFQAAATVGLFPPLAAAFLSWQRRALAPTEDA